MAGPLEAFCGSPLWDLNLVWNTTNPDFPECFQKTVFVWVPFGFLWLFAVVQARSLIKSKKVNIPLTGLNVTKVVLGLILMLLVILELSNSVHLYSLGEYVPAVDFVTPFIKLLTFILVTTFMSLERQRGIQTTGVVFVFWLLVLLASCVTYRTQLLRMSDGTADDTLEYVLHMVYFPLIVAQFLLSCVSDAPPNSKNTKHDGKQYSKLKPPVTQNICPQDNSTFFSYIFFVWFDKMALLGYKRPLEKKDLWDMKEEDSSRSIVAAFEKHWDTEVLKYQNTKPATHTEESKRGQPSLFIALCKTFGPSFLFGAFLKLIGDLLAFTSPLVLQLLITFVSNPDEPGWRGFFYAAIIFASTIVQSVIMGQYNYQMFLIGMRVRSSVISTVYRKAMRMSTAAKRTSTVGEIVNLMSVDAQRFMDLTQFLNLVWSSPVQIAIALVLLWGNLGQAVLAGLAVMILLIPTNGIIASKSKTLHVKMMKLKDQRIKLMNEVLNGMKVLKLYAWEESFSQQISAIRNKELKVLKSLAYLNAFTAFIWSCAPFVIMLATLATYVLISEENVLDASKAFVSLSLFDIIRMPMAFLPMMIVSIIAANVSFKRMNKYLSNDELDPFAVTHNPVAAYPLSVEGGTFSWSPDGTPVLRDINLHVTDGSLVAIVGPVGAGKSSLIAALLGELTKLEGRVNTRGTIAYVAQQAWVQNATLKNNILFGNPLDDDKYNTVIEACALQPDFDMLPASDNTEIGEKGINLSGGQKQRVSLARAVYNNSEIYLLDDPLSAVDSHVGKHIFDKVIGPSGLLKGKTRILVTHGITYLSQVDNIVVLSDGAISEVGSYEELLEKKGEFAEFLMTYLTQEGEAEDLEGLDDLKEELIAKLGPELERRISQSVTRALSNISQASENSSDGGRVSPARKISVEKPSETRKQAEGTADGKSTGKLVAVETSVTGKVKTRVYIHYLSSIGALMGFLIILLNVGSQGAAVGSNIWLSEWSNDKPTVNGTQDTQLRDLRLGVYGALGFTQIALVFVASITLALGTIRSSRLLHSQMLENILCSPMSFFDTTPLGRIVNRFGKDIDVVDTTLPMMIRGWLNAFLRVISTIIVISVSTPIFTAVIVPLGILYYFIQTVYVSTSRQLKRLESVSRSPIYSHFSETINGAVTIRAYGREAEFISISERKVDENQVCYFPSIASGRWLSVRLEFMGNLVVFSAALFAVLSRETMNPGVVGLSVSYAMTVTTMLNMLVRLTSELETNIVAVERITEYVETPQEAARTVNDQRFLGNWPQKGEIEFRDYTTRYRPGLDLVLHGITCSIGSGEKIGIVGRTGAGKSSLTLALFRLIEPAGGTIIIDGVDVAKIGLHDLRKKLTIIPQDPVLFSGTLRLNLDPFDTNTDEELWKVLEQSHLKTFVQNLPMGLQHEIAEGGENVSVGQRQLICLARALLRKTKILVLDEATAAVDLETDDLIQATISKEFSHCTIIVIAHRLNTIMDSTRVLVLDQGKIKEFDSPTQLLQDRKSLFYGMAKDAGLV